MLHIEVLPAPLAAATAQATARRILGGVRVQYLPSGQVARRLHMSSRTLGKITGQLAFSQHILRAAAAAISDVACSAQTAAQLCLLCSSCAMCSAGRA